MRLLVVLYLLIGIGLLLFGIFETTGDCPEPSGDIPGKAAFVLAWPVFLYTDLLVGGVDSALWLHQRGCQPGNIRPLSELRPPMSHKP